MSMFPFISGKRAGKNANTHKSRNSHYRQEVLRDAHYGIYFERYFREMLCLERKRAERSKKPFLLMLVYPDGDRANEDRDKVLNRICQVALSCTREIDIKGWYHDQEVVGVIFIEIGETGLDDAKEGIYEKIHAHMVNSLDSDQLSKIRISFHIFPEPSENEAKIENDLTLYPELLETNPIKSFYGFVKRTMDVCLSLLAILLLSPFFIIIALAVKLTSEGPVLFRQTRVGQYGKSFTFLKFRSMFVNCDSKVHQEYIKKFIKERAGYAGNGSGGNDKVVYKVTDDPRVTKVGSFIRKTSLDEIPQFFNVLKGDMSLVGPRPAIPYELASYDPWHRRRIMELKPGITGLWQISGRSSITFDDMVRLDLKYTREWSLWLDLSILFKTPWVVLSGKGAY